MAQGDIRHDDPITGAFFSCIRIPDLNIVLGCCLGLSFGVLFRGLLLGRVVVF